MKIILNIEDEEDEKYVFRDIAKIIESAQETGQCLLKYSDNKTEVFVRKTKTGYKINAWHKK